MSATFKSPYSVFDHLKIGVFVLEQEKDQPTEFRVRYFNQSVASMSPYSAQEILGSRVRDLYPMIYRYGIHKKYMECVDSQQPMELGTTLYGDAHYKRQYVDINIAPTGERSVILYYNYVTDHMIEVNDLTLKNEELTHFAHVVSHDLVEPINTIQGYLSLGAKEAAKMDNPRLHKYMDVIQHSASRMKDLVSGLLDFSKLNHSPDFERIQFSLLINDVVNDLSQQIDSKQARISVEILPDIWGYPILIRSLFQNLISNALKFHETGSAPKVKIGVTEDYDYWHFFVTDNGIGISEKDREKIFLMFEKLNGKDRFQGAGIGLAHCHKIVNMHMGKIWVDSTKGEGSTFWVKLPKEPITT